MQSEARPKPVKFKEYEFVMPVPAKKPKVAEKEVPVEDGEGPKARFLRAMKLRSVQIRPALTSNAAQAVRQAAPRYDTVPTASISALPFAPGPQYSIAEQLVPLLPSVPPPPSFSAGYRLPRRILRLDQLAPCMRLGSLEDRRRAIQAHVEQEEKKWETTLEEMIAMENAFRHIWKDPALQEICFDPGRLLWRTKFPDDGLTKFLRTDIDLIALRRNISGAPRPFPRHWACLRTYCSFVGRYAMELPPAEYIYVLKVWDISSTTECIEILSYGFRLPLPLCSSVCLLLLNDPFFLDYDAYTPAFLSRAMTPEDFFVAIPFQHFEGPAFQLGCPVEVIIEYLRNSLLPDKAALEADLSATFDAFSEGFPKLLRLTQDIEPALSTQIYKGVLDNTFTIWHHQLVKHLAPAKWDFYTPSRQLFARLCLAMPEQRKLIARLRLESARAEFAAGQAEEVREPDKGEESANVDDTRPATEHKCMENAMVAASRKQEINDLTRDDDEPKHKKVGRSLNGRPRDLERNGARMPVIPAMEMCVELDNYGNPLYTWRVK